MLTYPIALLLGSSSAVAAAGGSSRRNQPNRKQFEKELYGNSAASAALREKVMAKATFSGGRKLEDANGNYQNGYYDQNGSYQEGYYDQDGNYQNSGSQGYYGEYGGAFDPSYYALSYHRCAAVKQFDTEIAAERDTKRVFTTKNFAVFRFCPVDSCDSNYDGRRLEDAEEEEQDVYDGNGNKVYGGARGNGCKKNYGEYMMELEDYLQIMMEHQEERAQQFCTYCENEMYEAYMQNYNTDDYNNYYNNNNGGRQLLASREEFDFAAHHRELYSDDSVCGQYPYVCGDGGGDDDGGGGEDYMECTAGENDDDGYAVYVGPHCAADGYTITRGLYADEDCDVYVGGDTLDDGNSYSFSDYYNQRYGSSLVTVYGGIESAMCIPCAGGGNGGGDDGDDDGDDDGNQNQDGICQQVYESSARCERHYNSFSKSGLTDRQWEETQLSCSFIDSVVMGNYDESGYANLEWTWGPSYAKLSTSVSPLQVFLLVFSVLACAILAVWSKTLHASLSKASEPHSWWGGEKPWSPRGGRWSVPKIFRKEDHQDREIGPSESGIGASRVRSDATSYYVS